LTNCSRLRRGLGEPIEEVLMKRFLVVIVLVVVVVLAGVGGLGFYRGWFTLAMDRGKIQADKEKVVEKVDNLTHPSKTKTETPVPPSQQQE